MNKRLAAPHLTRRGLLTGAAGLGSALVMGSSLAPAEAAGRPSHGKPLSPAAKRLSKAFEARRRAAEHARGFGAGIVHTNGEEDALPGRIACYSKGLPHDRTGEVDAKA